ncbi:C4-dicarboxylate transporter DctM subunit [Bradyrhizobium sp. LB9.1b]
MSAPIVLALMTICFLSFGYLGVPVPFSLMAGVFIGALLSDVSLAAIIQKIFDGVDSEALLAIPFFLLVGELMSSANVVVRIANLSVSLVGHIRGGLSQVVVVFSMFFSEMSGSTTADVAVMSRALGGPMKREGYEPAFIAAIIASASTIAALVPPSITAVVYGAVGNVSIAGLFMAGVVPGLMIGFGLMIYCYFFGPSGLRKPRAPLRQVVFAAGDAALPLMIPVILLGGILTGWFTPTEAGVVAVVWIVVVVIPALNRGHIRKIPYDFCLAGLIFSLPLITIGAANAFGWMLAYLRGASYIADVITSMAGNDPHLIMLLMVLLFTVVGRLHRACADHHHLHATGQHTDGSRRHQRRAYGRGADRNAGLRSDHTALRPGAADGVEIRGRQFCKSATRRVADLPRVPWDDCVRDLLPERGAVAAAESAAGIGRMLQVAGGHGLYLSQVSLLE